jgi:hypothetical protein
LSRWMLISETRNYDLVNKFSYSYLTYQAQWITLGMVNTNSGIVASK